jgi:DNA-binding transcriptional regulator GbsR (MarR family)
MAASDEPATLDTVTRWTRRSRSTVVRGIAQLVQFGAVKRDSRPGRRTEFSLTLGQWWASSIPIHPPKGGRSR